MDKDKYFTAKFITTNLILSLSSDPPDAGTLTGHGEYQCNDKATLKATPNDPCYEFIG